MARHTEGGSKKSFQQSPESIDIAGNIFLGGREKAAMWVKEDFVRKYHFIFAGICAGLSLGWVFFTTPYLTWIPFALAIPYTIIGLTVKGVTAEETQRNALVTTLELTCFVSIYACMFVYWLEM